MSYVTVPAFMGVGVTFTVLSLATVAARVYARKRTTGLGLDDWLCIVALFLVLGECGIFIASATAEVGGSHTPDQEQNPGVYTFIDHDQTLLERYEYALDVIQIITLTLLKLSALCFYRRLFQRNRWFNVTSWVMVGLAGLWGLGFFIAFLSTCGTNLPAFWTSLGGELEFCASVFKLNMALSISDVIIDLGILALPIPVIWSLHMPIRRKLAVTLSMLVGALAISCGLARMILFIQILAPNVTSTADRGGESPFDQQGVVSLLMFWAMLEMGVGIIAISLPTLRPLAQTPLGKSIYRGLGLSTADQSLVSGSKYSRRMPHGTREDYNVKAAVWVGSNDEDGHKSSGEEMRVWVGKEVRQEVASQV